MVVVVVSRDPEELRFEVDYWRSVSAELEEVHELLVEAAGELVTVPIASLELMLGDFNADRLREAIAPASSALVRLGAMQDHLIAALGLIGGRLQVLLAEAGLEEPEP